MQIYYLHGYIGEDTEAGNIDVVLSQAEFRNAYQPDGFLKRFLIEAFRREDVCFIGCGLRGDDPIKRVFEVCQQEHAQSAAAVQQRGGAPKRSPKRFIFRKRPAVCGDDGTVDSDSTQLDIEGQEAYFRGLDIKVIWYKNHSVLSRAFSDLAGLPDVRLSGLWNGGKDDAN